MRNLLRIHPGLLALLLLGFFGFLVGAPRTDSAPPAAENLRFGLAVNTGARGQIRPCT